MQTERLFSRAVIRISAQEQGESPADFLQGLVTNDVTGALPAYGGLLSAQGKALFDFIIWPGSGGDLLIDCEAEAADDLVKRLSIYRLRRKIGIARDDSLGVYWRAESADDGTSDPRIADPRLASLGQRWISATSGDDAAADAAWLRHRLALGVPEGRAELGEILWLETNAAELNGVSFTKGCYIGQENTARMNWRQKINRRLVVVPLDNSDEARRKVGHEQLGLAVDHLRVGSIDPASAPDWMALAAPD